MQTAGRLADKVQATQKVEIDAVAADAVWARAPRVSTFRQYEPKPDADPSEGTEFQVSYDSDNLYVFVRAWDDHPDSIMHALSRRDVQSPSDQIGIYINMLPFTCRCAMPEGNQRSGGGLGPTVKVGLRKAHPNRGAIGLAHRVEGTATRPCR